MSWVAAANVRFPLWPGAGDFLPLHSISRWGIWGFLWEFVPVPAKVRDQAQVRKVRWVNPRMTASNAVSTVR